MADLRGSQIQVATEAPSRQAIHTIRLEFGGRAAPGGTVPSIRLWLDGLGAIGPADLGPAEAREVARYLIALADSVEEARK